MRLPLHIVAVLLTSAVLAEPWSIERDGWSFDRADLGDPTSKKYLEQQESGTLRGLTGWAEYDVSVPADGWYELLLRGGVPGWARTIAVDGEMVLPLTTSGAEDQIEKGLHKETNLYLTAGDHRLRIRRLHFPGCLPRGWILRAASGPEGALFARVDGPRVLRVGEELRLIVRGGGFPATVEIVRFDAMNETKEAIGSIEFSEGDRDRSETLSIQADAQGVFRLRAAVDGVLLRPTDFHGGDYVVIDTDTPPSPGAEDRTLIHDIDCVAQTDREEAIVEGAGFLAAFEPTRVVTTAAGTYREGGNVMDPDIPLEPKRRHDPFLTGFSYAIDVPDKQVPTCSKWTIRTTTAVQRTSSSSKHRKAAAAGITPLPTSAAATKPATGIP